MEIYLLSFASTNNNNYLFIHNIHPQMCPIFFLIYFLQTSYRRLQLRQRTDILVKESNTSQVYDPHTVAVPSIRYDTIVVKDQTLYFYHQ